MDDFASCEILNLKMNCFGLFLRLDIEVIKLGLVFCWDLPRATVFDPCLVSLVYYFPLSAGTHSCRCLVWMYQTPTEVLCKMCRRMPK